MIRKWSGYAIIGCPDRGCAGNMRVPAPATITPTNVTCDGMFPHHWTISSLDAHVNPKTSTSPPD
jgi:hypothetical protein